MRIMSLGLLVCITRHLRWVHWHIQLEFHGVSFLSLFLLSTVVSEIWKTTNDAHCGISSIVHGDPRHRGGNCYCQVQSSTVTTNYFLCILGSLRELPCISSEPGTRQRLYNVSASASIN